MPGRLPALVSSRYYGAMNTPHRYIRRRPKPGRRVWVSTGCVLLVLFLANAGIALAYNNRTYPGARVAGKPAGNMAYGTVVAHTSTYIPTSITVTYKDKKTMVSVSNFGITLDKSHVAQSLSGSRAWPPAANFFVHQSADLPLRVNETLFADGFSRVQKAYEQQPAPPALVRDDYIFKITPRIKAVTIDRQQFRTDLLAAVGSGRTAVAVTIMPTTADQLKAADEQYQWQQLIDGQNTAITYQFTGEKTKRLTVREVNMFYVPKGKTYELSDAHIAATVMAVGQEFGITPTNVPQAVAATKEAIAAHQALQFSLLAVTPPL
jgi:hypothetical protein